MSDTSPPSLGRTVLLYHAGAQRAFAAVVTGTIREDGVLASAWHVNLRVDWDETGYGECATMRNVPFAGYYCVVRGGHWNYPPRDGGAR